jgi:hypothetical protein
MRLSSSGIERITTMAGEKQLSTTLNAPSEAAANAAIAPAASVAAVEHCRVREFSAVHATPVRGRNVLYALRAMKHLIVASIYLSLSAVVGLAQFSDSTFTTGWVDTILSPSTLGRTSSSILGTGGNPATSRTTTQAFPFVAPSTTGRIWVAHINSSSTYNPTTQGSITSLSFSYDLIFYKSLSSTNSGGIGYALLAFQNGTYYSTIGDAARFEAWTAFPHAPVAAADFSRIDGTGPDKPDFTCGGAPIQFGYVTLNSNPTSSLTTTASATAVGGIDNWKVDVKSAPCCASIAIGAAACKQGGATESLTITNTSNQPAEYILLSPPVGATYTVSPSVTDLGSNPLAVGNSTTISAQISNQTPNQQTCVNVSLADSQGVSCCLVRTCFEAPACNCGQILDNSIRCNPSGGYTYFFTLQNLTTSAIQQFFVVPVQTTNVTVSPQLINLSTPLQSQQTTNQSVSIQGAPGTQVCLRFTPLSELGSTCCSFQRCFVLPSCSPPADQ